MATVYLAEDLKHSRKVAIKVLHPELSAVIGGDRFLTEIKVTANLQHPHILGAASTPVSSRRSRLSTDLLYYVMPYVSGESLPQSPDARQAAPHRRRASSREGSGLRPRLRPSPGRRPPRHQAGEHPAAGRLGPRRRLRHRARRAAGRRLPHDADRHVARHPGLHVARAGHGRARHRRPQRRVRARRHDLRDADRRAALHRAQQPGHRGEGVDGTTTAVAPQASVVPRRGERGT